MRYGYCFDCGAQYEKPNKPGNYLYCEPCKDKRKEEKEDRTKYCLLCGVAYERPYQLGSFLYCEECRNKGVSKEKAKVYLHNARAAELRLTHDLTLQQWFETLEYFGFKCAFCRGTYTALEHYGPLIHGYGTTWNNCVPSCSRCNAKKSGKARAAFKTIFSPIAIDCIEEYLQSRSF